MNRIDLIRFVSFILTITMVSCEGNKSFDIPDVTKKYEKLVFSRDKYPSNISICIEGETNGSFQINGILFEKGRIDTTFLMDQYADSMQIFYKPFAIDSGKLKISYLY